MDSSPLEFIPQSGSKGGTSFNDLVECYEKNKRVICLRQLLKGSLPGRQDLQESLSVLLRFLACGREDTVRQENDLRVKDVSHRL